MNNIIKFLAITFVMFGIQIAQSQTVSDALRYSQTEMIGSARSLGVANSMNAIGADFSTFSINPAGLGAYRSSEFVITPLLFSAKTKSSLEGGGVGPTSTSESNLAIGNLGIVMASRPRRGGALKTSNFAIGINRIGDFNQQFSYSGKTGGSITDRFIELSDGVLPENLNGFEEGLAYSTGAIFDFDEDLIYDNDLILDEENTGVQKSETITSSGSNTELSLTYGGNISEKFLFGASVNLPIVNFESIRTYQEEDTDDSVDFFNSLTFEEFLTTTGVGLNFKLGAIYNVDQAIRLGVALHTPTKYALTDDYTTAMEYSFTDANGTQTFNENSPRGSFNYNLQSPWKAIGSLGIVLKKAGFISAEVEWNDYSNAAFDYDVRGNGPAFRESERLVNVNIDQTLGSSLKFKVGGEAAIKILRIRAGLTMEQSPYTNDDSFNNSYHFGLGIRENKLLIDVGYQLKTINEGYAPYLVSDDFTQPLVQNDVTQGRLVLSVGVRF